MDKVHEQITRLFYRTRGEGVLWTTLEDFLNNVEPWSDEDWRNLLRNRVDWLLHQTRKIAGVFLLSIGLSACTTITWARPETDSVQFTRDQYECNRDARPLAGGSGLIGAIAILGAQHQAQEMYERRMISKGYTK